MICRDYYPEMARRHAGREARPSLAFVDVLARRAISGDGSAGKELADRVLAPIAEGVAGKYAAVGRTKGLDRDDLRQEAMAGMLSSLSDWNPERGTFRTFVFARARYAVMNAVNGYNAVAVGRNLAEHLGSGRGIPDGYSERTKAAAALAVSVPLALDSPLDGDEEAMHKRVGEAERGFEEVMARLELSAVLGRYGSLLTDREKRVVAARYVYDRTFRTIGRAMGMTPQGAANHAWRGIKKLRGEINTRARKGVG